MSTTFVSLPITGCLVKAEDIAGAGLNWRSVSDLQCHFLEQYFASECGKVASLPDIESIVSWSIDEINQFLKNHGFDIQLEDNDDPSTFGVASVLDVLVEWPEIGALREIVTAKGDRYEGVRLLKHNVFVQKARCHEHPIVQIRTKSGDVVNMTVSDGSPGDGFALMRSIATLRAAMEPDYTRNSAVVFPMIDLNQQVSLDWLLGMVAVRADGSEDHISQALQQNKLRMNEVGARAQSAATIAVTRGISVPSPDVVIDRPFYFWIERQGLERPLFSAYITEADWKNPGSLD